MNPIIMEASAAACAARTVLLRLLPIILGLAVLCLSVPSYSGEAAAVPDFNGLWHRESFQYTPPYLEEGPDGTADVVIDGYDNPILKPWTVEILMQKAHSFNSGRIFPHPNTSCWPDSLNSAFTISNLQIVQTPSQITIVFRDDQQVRHIYMNESHTGPIQRGWYGESVGYFEGDTLVVDTIGFHEKPQAMIDQNGTPVTEGLHITEWFRVLDDGNRLQVEVTVDDPKVFKKAWSTMHEFEAAEGVVDEYRCAENNRDWPDLAPMAERPDF